MSRKIAKDAPPSMHKVGLREIAQAARVSIATTSRVLNGNSRVDPKIQKVVWQEAKKLGIDPVERNRNRTLAFLVSNRVMLHEFHSRVLVGAEAFCTASGWDMVYLSSNYSPYVPWTELHLPKLIQRSDLIRGVILAGTTSMNMVTLLASKGIAFAALGNNVLGADKEIYMHDTVFADDIQGGQEATRHLVSLGHRHIWFVGNIRLPWFARCFEGYRRAMQDAGLAPNQISTHSEDDAEGGYLSTKTLLARGGPVTAIFAGNDPTAHGVYKCLREKGLTIPDDVSVAGCDDTIGTWLNPALSSIREFPEQIGKHLVEMVLSRINQPDQRPCSVTIPTEFVRRESCGPPRESAAG